MAQDVAETSNRPPGNVLVLGLEVRGEVARRLGHPLEVALDRIADHPVRRVVLEPLAARQRLDPGDGVEHVPEAVRDGSAGHQNTSTRSSRIVSQNRGRTSSRITTSVSRPSTSQSSTRTPARSSSENFCAGGTLDQHVDVAPATGIAARQRAEQPEPGHAERPQLGLVRAQRTHDEALALDERRVGSLHVGGHGGLDGVTMGPYRRATRVVARSVTCVTFAPGAAG